jgi:hypothetical protein
MVRMTIGSVRPSDRRLEVSDRGWGFMKIEYDTHVLETKTHIFVILLSLKGPQVRPPGSVPVTGPGRPGVPTGHRTEPVFFGGEKCPVRPDRVTVVTRCPHLWKGLIINNKTL